MIERGDKVLLLDRPEEKGNPGLIAPGGKVDYPESPLEGAIREVKEETGLNVLSIQYKGLDEYTNEAENLRYMVFNYLATDFSGELLNNPPEGELHWIHKEDVLDQKIQTWFARKFPLFFEEGTFEIHTRWDGEKDEVIETKVFAL
jgi:8-oxo-dGTP diphosphatase